MDETFYPSNEDIMVWPDGTWCYREELGEMSHMSDDYYVISISTKQHTEFLNIYN